MKLSHICFGLLFFLLSCQSTQKEPANFSLLPLPQEFEITGVSQLTPDKIQSYYAEGEFELPVRGNLLSDIQATDQATEAQILCKIDPALELKAEGYLMEITKNQVSLTGKDEAGLLYGFMTLEQLMEDAVEQKGALPLCEIKDYPALAYRAIQLDIKHHIEKTSYYYQLIDELASYKVNGIIVELEDKLKYELQPLVGSADALSIEEWQKLSDYAKARNIEISPLIQGLGHASFILKHDQYKALRDDPESDWAFNPLLPETYKVQFDLYADAIKATPHGKYLHIGGDEVHTTGGGSGQSPLELQLIWLDKVCKYAEENGRIPIFWDDMPLKHAGVYRPMFNTKLSKEEVDKIWEENEQNLVGVLDLLPKNCIYMRWNYSSPETIGNRKAMEWFTSNGFKVMGATAGQTRWVLMPQKESNMDAIRNFANISIDNQADGLLLTLWDDDSPHFELYKRGILFFSEYTWTGDKRSKADIKAAYRHRSFSSKVASEEYAFIDDLEQPVAFWKNAFLNGNRRNYVMAHEQPEELLMDLPDTHKKGSWSEKHAARLTQAEEVAKVCDSVEFKLKSIQDKAIRNKYRLEVYEQVNKLTAYSPKVLLALKQYDAASNEQEEKEAIKQVQELITSFGSLRKELEEVYGKTRILHKPDNYILDQDHHVHLANQSQSFDWQFHADQKFLKAVEEHFEEIIKVKG